MNRVAIVGLVVVGALAYWLGNRLSSDAVGLAVGVVFGLLAGVPGAVLVMLVAQRDGRQRQHDEPTNQVPAVYQPPVIICTGSQHTPQLPDMRQPGAVRGEREAWVVDSWQGVQR